jgi:hypothetical protein
MAAGFGIAGSRTVAAETAGLTVSGSPGGGRTVSGCGGIGVTEIWTGISWLDCAGAGSEASGRAGGSEANGGGGAGSEANGRAGDGAAGPGPASASGKVAVAADALCTAPPAF